jgi:NAD(P)-dependent dehydrogenase (short-subunit alcohol dehydrogenase family)
MVERGRGSIVNVASSASLQGYAYAAAYCVAKHAVLGYTRAAALELERKGVRVHAVCPHYVDTDLTSESVRRIVAKTGRSAEEAREFLAAQNPGGRLIEPGEVAEAVLTLLQSERGGLLAELDGSGPPHLRPLEPRPAQ